MVTNRFAVCQNKAAKFEQRWVTRKSRLASLDGYKYFHLIRRVTSEDVPPQNAAAFEQRLTIHRESKFLKDWEGFMAFHMLRRDGQAKGYGVVKMNTSEPTYLSTTIWRDLASLKSGAKKILRSKKRVGKSRHRSKPQ
jgi:heme-degrading monooxygenase HmoA